MASLLFVDLDLKELSKVRFLVQTRVHQGEMEGVDA